MTHFMLKAIHHVNVLGYELDLIPDEKDMPQVPLHKLCEAIGLNYLEELSRLAADPRFGASYLLFGEHERVACIPLNKLHAFLFTIDDATLPPASMGKLTMFQMECVDVLSDYWNKGAAINDRINHGSTESPYRDCRAQSRPELVQAVKRLVDYDTTLDPEIVYEALIGFCWDMLGSEGPILAEDQKLSDQVNGIHGINAYLLAEMERTAVALIDTVIENDMPSADIIQNLEEAIRNSMAKIGERAWTLS